MRFLVRFSEFTEENKNLVHNHFREFSTNIVTHNCLTTANTAVHEFPQHWTNSAQNPTRKSHKQHTPSLAHEVNCVLNLHLSAPAHTTQHFTQLNWNDAKVRLRNCSECFFPSTTNSFGEHTRNTSPIRHPAIQLGSSHKDSGSPPSLHYSSLNKSASQLFVQLLLVLFWVCLHSVALKSSDFCIET